MIMPTKKADLLHQDVSEKVISRLSHEAEDRLQSQGRKTTLRSLSYLKFAFENRRGSAMIVRTEPDIS